MKDLTPKEKAKELVDKLNSQLLFIKDTELKANDLKFDLKRNANIVVDEIIELLSFDLGHDSTANGLLNYFEEVKSEIEKL